MISGSWSALIAISPLIGLVASTRLGTTRPGREGAARLTAVEAGEQPFQGGGDARLLQAVVDLLALLAGVHQAGAAQHAEVVGDGGAAEAGQTLGELADVELVARQQQHEILPAGVSERLQRLARLAQVLAQRPELRWAVRQDR